MKRKVFSYFFPVIVIFIVTCLIFFKIFLKGLYPIPADLLVSFYFPWYSGSWEGYNPWTTHKEMLGADSIRQIYPWKEFAASQFKMGQFPLWNPYTFSGQPLSANFQSSVYYPFNIFYFLTDPKNAWILLITIQPFLGGIFMYMATRSFKLPKITSLFAAVSFMFSSYLITWIENGNITHSYIWLPFSFWAINNFFEKFKFRYLVFLIISFTLSLLAGHPQTIIYVYMATFAFYLYKMFGEKVSFKYFGFLIFAILLSITLSAIQLIPTYDFYKASPMSLPFAREVFDRSILPVQNLITFFASDFFGHPANNNFWSRTYGDFTPYLGVIPLVFALWAIFHLWKERFIKFASVTAAIFILAAVRGPITYLIEVFKLPLLSATTPSRFISISIFLLITLSAYGLNDFLKNIESPTFLKRFQKFLIAILLIYLAFWLFTIFGIHLLSPKETWQINLAVSRRNLILPTFMFLSIFTLVIGLQYFNFIKRFGYLIAIIGIFFATLVGGIYYTNKFLPVAPKQFIFPDHLLFNWLKNNAGIDRFYGAGTAHIDFNFPTYYQVYGVEGYDTLRFKRYAELLASSFSGQVPQSYLRSDGVIPNEENGYRKRLFELLGVKYLLDKEDDPKTGSDWHYERFSNDKVVDFWQEDKFQVYKRTPVLPRVFLTTKYLVIKNDREIIQKIYDPNYNLETLILEEKPSLEIVDNSQTITIPQVTIYQPNFVTIKTNVNYNSLLFLSDVYDEDWNVYIDGQKSKLLRADYALRGVAVSQGMHQIEFKYQPKSFNQGLIVTTSSIVTLFVISLFFIKKKRF